TASKRTMMGLRLIGLGLATAAAVAVTAPASAFVIAPNPGPQLGADVPPLAVEGDATFKRLGFECEFTLEVKPVKKGQFGPVSLTQVVSGKLVDFRVEDGYAADGVLVRGGVGANAYDYRAMTGATEDQDLHAPVVEVPAPDEDDKAIVAGFGFEKARSVEFCLNMDATARTRPDAPNGGWMSVPGRTRG
ncbi:hypothetical protein, partial [Nocardiopsis sp. CNR-923]|uniref:hypothetical protein n=1 Tax=Nocardiopsis sp. CNR-923 TaxID=1904965 RepID=UPI0013012FFF